MDDPPASFASVDPLVEVGERVRAARNMLMAWQSGLLSSMPQAELVPLIVEMLDRAYEWTEEAVKCR